MFDFGAFETVDEETVVDYFKVLFRDSSEGTEKLKKKQAGSSESRVRHGP
jgi:hypothetical protein